MEEDLVVLEPGAFAYQIFKKRSSNYGQPNRSRYKFRPKVSLEEGTNASK